MSPWEIGSADVHPLSPQMISSSCKTDLRCRPARCPPRLLPSEDPPKVAFVPLSASPRIIETKSVPVNSCPWGDAGGCLLAVKRQQGGREPQKGWPGEWRPRIPLPATTHERPPPRFLRVEMTVETHFLEQSCASWDGGVPHGMTALTFLLFFFHATIRPRSLSHHIHINC